MFQNRKLLQRMTVFTLSIVLLLTFGGCKKTGDTESKMNGGASQSVTESTDSSSQETDTSSLDPETVEPSGDPSVIKVEEYGAIANDDKDDANSLRRAIKAASNRGEGTTVQLSSGTYNINSAAYDAGENYFHTLYLSDIHGITIQGNNTTLMVDDPFMDVFYFYESSKITIKGITIDYSTDPWVQGTVTAVNASKGTFTLSVSNVPKSGKIILDDSRWIGVTTSRAHTSPFGMVRDDNDPRLLKTGVQSFFYGFSTPKKVKQGVYEIGLTNNTYKSWLNTNIKVGSKLVLLNRIDSVGAFRFRDCSGDITIENCKVYASVGTIFCIGGINGNVKINNVQTLIKPNSGRWLTSNADGMYMSNIKGSVTVTNSVFEGLSDDCMNLFTSGCMISQVVSGNQIRVSGSSLIVPNTGDKISVIDPMNGTVLGEATVTNSKKGSADTLSANVAAVLTLDKTITGMQAGTNLQDGSVVINQSVQAPGTTVTNNTFRYGRAKGVKLNVRNGKVSGNTFENLGSAAVNLHDIPALAENAGAYNVLVENNKIINCGFLLGPSSETTAAITVSGMRVDGGVARGYIHSGITIKNNTISNVFKHGIYVSSAQYVILENNSINGYSSDPATAGMSGVTLENVNQVRISNLTVNDPRSNLEGGLRLLSGCNNVKWQGNKFTLASGVAEVFEK